MLKKYGAFFIGAGIAVTGVLWYERDDGTIMGEDMAWAVNRAMDVHLIGRLMGDESPDYWGGGAPYDSFGSNILKGAVIGMEDLRKLALRVEDLPQWVNPVWVDPAYSAAFRDGAEILACKDQPALTVEDRVWTGYESGDYVEYPYQVRTYRAYAPTNVVSHVRTLAGRAWNGRMPFEKGVSLTNEPICRWLHGGAAMKWNYLMWPDGSFWTTNMGVKAYTLPFRRKHTGERYSVHVRPYYMRWMRLVDGMLNTVGEMEYVMTASKHASVAVRQDYPPAGAQMCALLDVVAADGTAQGFAAASGAFPPVEVSPGSNTVRVSFGYGFNPPANGRLVAQVVRNGNMYSVTGCNVYTNDTGNYDVQAYCEPSYGRPRADLLRVWLDVPGMAPGERYVAIGPAPLPGGEFRGAFRMDSHIGMVLNGAAGFNMWLNPLAPDTVVHDRTVTRRNLGAAKAVLDECRVSAYVGLRPFKSVRTVMHEYRSEYVFEWDNDLGAITADVFSSLRLTSVSTNDSVHPLFGGGLSVSALTWGESYKSSSGVCDYTFYPEREYELSYPSAYAVTNGFVGKIRVFAVCGYNPFGYEHAGGLGYWEPWVVFSKQFHADELPVSNLPHLSLCDETGVVKVDDSSGYFVDSYSLAEGFRGIKLNQIYVKESPSSTDDLRFTWNPPEMTPLNPGVTYTLNKQNGDYLLIGTKYGISVRILRYIAI